MTAIRQMNQDAFAAYKAIEVASFAEENVSCGRWQAKDAHDRSLAEFDELLPDGLDTPNNYLMEILEAEDAECIGYLWFAAEDRNGQLVAFIYDIQIFPKHRRRGHAKQALLLLEPVARSLGLVRISLHVSGQNPEAQALYERTGFAVMGISMSKRLNNEV